MLCFAGPIGLYLHQPGDPQLNENARSRWCLLQCMIKSRRLRTSISGELRRYLPSEVLLGRPDQLVTRQRRDGGR